MSDDCISRQAALDLPKNTERDFYGKIIEQSINIEHIKALPPVKPEQKWIPVSERLPDKNMNCWICTYDKCVLEAEFAIDLYKIDKHDFSDKKGKSGFYGFSSRYGYYEICGVMAWIPNERPEPYKEGEE